MDLHHFVEQLALAIDVPLEQEPDWARSLLLQTVSLAVKALAPGEVYCEVGRGEAETLIAALAHAPERQGYAVVDVAHCLDLEGQLDQLLTQLSEAGLQEQVWVCAQPIAEFWADFQTAGLTDKIGVYVDRASQDYRTQFLSLLHAQSLWAEHALIVLPGGDAIARWQAIQDFLQLNANIHLVTDPMDPGGDYGAVILSWGQAIQLKILPALTSPLPLASAGTADSSSDQELLLLIPPDARQVVEMGCGEGFVGARYKQINPMARYLGVEPNFDRARLARQRLDRVIAGSIEQADATTLNVAEGTVDCLIYGQGLADGIPSWQTVQHQVTWLREGGQVVARIPNSQHWSVLVQCLTGRWEEQVGGVARVHLPLLMPESIVQGFAACGLQVLNIKGIRKEEPEGEWIQLLEATARHLGAPPEQFQFQLHAHHYLVRAIKATVSPRTLLIYTRVTSSLCQFVRVLEPNAFSATIPGTRIVQTWGEISPHLAGPNEAKVFIWQRPELDYSLEAADWQAQQALLEAGYLVLVEVDDNPFGWSEARQKQFLRLLETCHGVQTSTPALAEILRPFHPNVVVFPNYLATVPPLPVRHPEDPVRIFLGSCNRVADSQALVPVLNSVLADYGDRVQISVINEREFFEALTTPYKQYEPCCPYSQYIDILRTCQIGLLPLLPSEFNRTKSDLKFLECAAHGVVAIASPTVYASSIEHGKTGLIFHSPEELSTYLRQLIDHQPWREQLATAAYQWVKEHRLLCQHYHQRRDWYLQMYDQCASR